MNEKELLKELLEFVDINNTDIIYDMERWNKIERFNRYYGGLFYDKVGNTPKTYVLSLENPYIEILIINTKKIDIETERFLVSENIADFINEYLKQQKAGGMYHIYINNDNRIPRNVGFYKTSNEISELIKNVCEFHIKCKNRFLEKIRAKESERDVLVKELKGVSERVKKEFENILELNLAMLKNIKMIEKRFPVLVDKETKKCIEKKVIELLEKLKNCSC